MYRSDILNELAKNKLLNAADCYFTDMKTDLASPIVTKKLYKTDNFSDIKIIVEETTFNLHKAILCASCPFFEVLIQSENVDTIYLKETPMKLFEIVVEYIYTSNCDIKGLSESDIIDLLKLGREYLFKEFLATILLKKETPFSSLIKFIILIYENCSDGEEEKKEKCLQFFDTVSKYIIEKSYILNFNTNLLKAMFTRSTFFVNEIDLFYSLKFWYEYNGQSNPEIFTYLRLGDIHPKHFIKIIKPSILIETNTYLKELAEGSQPLNIEKTRGKITHFNDYDEYDDYDSDYGKYKRQKSCENNESDCDSNDNSLFSSFSNLFKNPMFSDLTIVVENTEFHLHKAILYTSGDFFKTLLDEADNLGKIEISTENIRKRYFEKIIEFVYTNDFSLIDYSEVDVLNLINILIELKFDKMVLNLFSKTFINEKSSVEFVLQFFEYCKERKVESTSACYTYFDNFAENIIQNEAFTKISKSSLLKIVSRGSFCIPEIDIFEGVNKWIVKNKDCSPEILATIRLGEIDVSDYWKIVKPTGFFDDDNYLHNLVQTVEDVIDPSDYIFSNYRRVITQKKIRNQIYTSRYNIMKQENYILCNENEKSFLLPIIIKLHKSKKFTDVSFVVEGCQINLHKSILAASCPYFETMLFGTLNESKMDEITLNHTLKKPFENVIEFIYASKLDITNWIETDILEILDLSREYLFQDLINHLMTQIVFKSDSSIDYIISIYEICEEFNVIETKDKCFNYLIENFKTLIEDSEKLSKIPAKLLTELLSNYEIFSDEIDVFKTIKRWVDLNGNQNPAIFSSLRLNLITIKEYIEIIQPTGLIKLDTYLIGLNDKKCEKRKHWKIFIKKEKIKIDEYKRHESGYCPMEPGKLLRSISYILGWTEKISSITFDVKLGENIRVSGRWMNRSKQAYIGANIFSVETSTNECFNTFKTYITHQLHGGYYVCEAKFTPIEISSFTIRPVRCELIANIFNVECNNVD